MIEPLSEINIPTENDLLITEKSKTHEILNIIDDSKEKIQKMATAMLICSFSFLLYLIFICIKLQHLQDDHFYWEYTNIPLAICLLSLSMSFLYYTDFERYVTMELGKSVVNAAVALLNLAAMVFAICMTFYLDKMINPPIWTIFVPLFVLFGLVGLLLIFLLPGFLDKNRRNLKIVSIIVIYYIALMTFSIILCLRLDQVITCSFGSIFSILLSALILHFIILLIECGDKGYKNSANELIFICSAASGLILIFINFNNQETKISWYGAFTPFFFGGLYLFATAFIFTFESFSLELD